MSTSFDAEINPATGEPFNSARAEWVRPGLNDFASRNFNESFDEMAKDGVDGDAPSVLQDFITDSLHMAVKLGMSASDAEYIAEKAVRMFLAEHKMEEDAEAEAAEAAADCEP